MSDALRPVRRALLSVSDKTGLLELARALARHDVEILSTGGTARLLANQGLTVREVAHYTGFPEIMDGRLKTLHPKIHGGLLGRRGVDDTVMALHGIQPIDLLVVNLYPFAATVARPNCRYEEAIEHIDIGGPAMLRAAAKNHDSVAVAVDPGDYAALVAELDAHDGATTAETRARLAAKVFAHTARYDTMVAGFLAAHHAPREEPLPNERFPATLALYFERAQLLRYGENPHQQAALYRDGRAGDGLARARMLQGKDLSFNNLVDADTAIECVRQFEQPACAIVKHANPCGVAVAGSLLDAYERAYRTDPTSAFGGVIAFNQPLEAAVAHAVLGRQFVEIIAAPAIEAGATQALSGKASIRVLELGALDEPPAETLEYRSICGGLLAQTRDVDRLTAGDLQVVTRRQPTPRQLEDLLFAWRVVKLVKSNAIVYAHDGATIGIGAGQMSRMYSSRLAAMKAADEKLVVAGAVMASDAFFPFRDGVDVAAQYGIAAVIQPGGSRNDAEVIAAADEHGMAMVFTGMRHFRH